MRSRRKLWIAGAFILAGGFLVRFAWATYTDPFSVVIIILGAILFLIGIAIFAVNFRE
ncbi:hypothetical protein [Rubrolithibacter danxiaensis]|uniref:hypothetical protein n=1 Tax=Rubrolithibacter danxiaensis TaxID=3390805 RepID=UPI003BF7E64D